MPDPAPPGGTVDILVVSLASTHGLRHADAELLASLRRGGATVALATAVPPRRRLRTLVLTDLAWALAARRAAQGAIAAHRPRAVLYSTTTAALLWPRAGAIRFDALAAANRPGRHGLWQRPLERRRLVQATVLVPWSESSLFGAPAESSLFWAPARARARARGGPDLVVVSLPVPVEPSAPPGGRAPVRDIAAITYAANPAKKGLDRVLAAWASVRRPGELLYVAGTTPAELASSSIPLPSEAHGVHFTGPLPQEQYRALLRRSRVFVCAPRREDYGLAQLEALADGCLLVTTPAPGPYAALPIARSIDPRLVSDDLPAALRVALNDPALAGRGGMADGGERDAADGGEGSLAAALAPFRRAACDRVVRDRLLPALLGDLSA